jgi:DNA-binding CsgD family transcriptional regulator
MTAERSDVPTTPPDAKGAVAWLFMPPADVPERWQRRAVPLMMVPLLPAEAESVLSEGAVEPDLRGEEDLLRLVAQGLTRETIARRLGVSVRTVQRRLAAIQNRTGAGSLPELAVQLAQRGF